METFFIVLAWVLGIASTIKLLVTFYAWTQYSNAHRNLEIALKGTYQIFPMKYTALVVIICWSWVISTYLD